MFKRDRNTKTKTKTKTLRGGIDCHRQALANEDARRDIIQRPHLAEQHRIVTKVDEFRSYLNQLEKTILSEEII